MQLRCETRMCSLSVRREHMATRRDIREWLPARGAGHDSAMGKVAGALVARRAVMNRDPAAGRRAELGPEPLCQSEIRLGPSGPGARKLAGNVSRPFFSQKYRFFLKFDRFFLKLTLRKFR